MKKIYCFMIMAAVLLSLTACGGEQASAVTDTQDRIDVDLTQLSSTMVYSEVYNMMVTPDSYIGKNVKLKGQFTVYQNQSSGDYYYTVIIADAASCCSQGLEFVLAGNHDYPADYPEDGEEITVIGEFQTYQEGDYSYCHLINAEIV